MCVGEGGATGVDLFRITQIGYTPSRYFSWIPQQVTHMQSIHKTISSCSPSAEILWGAVGQAGQGEGGTRGGRARGRKFCGPQATISSILQLICLLNHKRNTASVCQSETATERERGKRARGRERARERESNPVGLAWSLFAHIFNPDPFVRWQRFA